MEDLVALDSSQPVDVVALEMQFPQVGEALQILNAIDEVVVEDQAAQFIELLDEGDNADMLVGQVYLIDPFRIFLANGL